MDCSPNVVALITSGFAQAKLVLEDPATGFAGSRFEVMNDGTATLPTLVRLPFMRQTTMTMRACTSLQSDSLSFVPKSAGHRRRVHHDDHHRHRQHRRPGGHRLRPVRR